jgi:ATP-dependent Clp protease ATP-binding subunit ClpX
MSQQRDAYCSFCRNSHHDVGPLVEGEDSVYICAACVELCQSIIEQEKRRRRSSATLPPLPPPENIEALLHFFLRVQRTITEPIAAAVHSHAESFRDAQRSESTKNVLLLVGPSWSSGVLLACVLAHILDVPFASGQAKDLALACSPTEPNASVFYRLLQAGDFDVETAQRGIVFLDRIDLPEAQEMLVNLLEDKGPAAAIPGRQLDVASILFICRGGFAGLDEQMVRRGRHPEQPITSEDLLALGVSLEFMRRVLAIVRVSALDEEIVVRLIASADLKRWSNDSGI